MNKRLTYIAPLQCGIIVGITQALVSLILFVPFFLLASLIGAAVGAGAPGQHSANLLGVFGGGIFVVVIAPIFYGIVGFIFGAIAALVYNLVAGWTGGLELTFIDVTVSAPPLPPSNPPAEY